MNPEPSDSTPQSPLANFSDGVLLGPEGMSNRGRRIMIAALLATCVAFLVAMLAVPRRDAPLTVALGAFVFDIPLLVAAFMFLLHDPESASTKPRSDAYIVGPGTVLVLSIIPMLVGFGAILWHLGVLILGLFVAGVIAAFAVSILVAASSERSQHKQSAEDSVAAGEHADHQI